MKKYIIFILSILILNSCNNNAGTKVVYTNGTPSIDSNSAYMVTIKDGKIQETYINKEDINTDNLKEAPNTLNDSSFYEYQTIEGIQKKVNVSKTSYRKENFSVSINNDSIKLGDSLVSYIYLNKNVNVSLKEEENYIKKIREMEHGQLILFSRAAKIIGVNSIEGIITNKKEKFPFKYNYAIVETL